MDNVIAVEIRIPGLLPLDKISFILLLTYLQVHRYTNGDRSSTATKDKVNIFLARSPA